MKLIDASAQVVKHDGQQDLAFVDLGSRASNQLRESWRSEPLFHSRHAIESVWLHPLLGGGGTVASSLLAGNVFLATANPATRMVPLVLAAVESQAT